MKLIEIKPIKDLCLTPMDETYWQATQDGECHFVTDEGTWKLRIKRGWITDLRSGPDIVNGVIPKWGNKSYSWCIFAHDVAFSGWMSFDLANELFLRQGLRMSCQVGAFRAALACRMVSMFGESHYHQMEDDLPAPYTINRTLESLTLEDK